MKSLGLDAPELFAHSSRGAEQESRTGVGQWFTLRFTGSPAIVPYVTFSNYY